MKISRDTFKLIFSVYIRRKVTFLSRFTKMLKIEAI